MGDPRRPAEEQAYVHFSTSWMTVKVCYDSFYMDGVILITTTLLHAGGEIDCTLEEDLVFFTGSSTIPPLGFKKQPKIVFLEDHSRVLPTASTCSLELRLPTCHVGYYDFKTNVKKAFQNHGGFGGV